MYQGMAVLFIILNLLLSPMRFFLIDSFSVPSFIAFGASFLIVSSTVPLYNILYFEFRFTVCLLYDRWYLCRPRNRNRQEHFRLTPSESRRWTGPLLWPLLDGPLAFVIFLCHHIISTEEFCSHHQDEDKMIME